MASSFQQLDLTIISAQDLNVVNLLSKMNVYVEATLSDHPGTKQRTPTHDKGHKNPSWNTKFQFSIPDNVDHSTFSIHIVLRAEKVIGDRVIGEVHIPIRELESDPKSLESNKFVSYQVRKPCGNFEGTLNVSYRFTHRRPPPQTSEPPPHAGVGYNNHPGYPQTPAGVYLPPPPGGYPPPPAGVYFPPPPGGYPPPPAGVYFPPPPGGYPPSSGVAYPYGVPPPAAPPSQKPNKKNLVVPAALVGVGGMLLANSLGNTIAGFFNASDTGDAGGFDG